MHGVCVASLLIYVPPVQGQCQPNRDKHDVATTPFTHLLHFFYPLMFIQVLIITLFLLFFIFPHLCWYSWLFLSPLLFPTFSPSSAIISSSFHSLAAIPSVFVPTLCSPPSLPCNGKVLTATHSGMAVNKRAKQKVSLTKLSLNTRHPALCLVHESGVTHRSSRP